MATVEPGKLVILDEPTNDVDPLRRRLLWQAVRGLADRGSAVLLVTHNVLEAERSVDRLAIIDRGRVVGAGTPASLKEREARHLRLELILEPETEPFVRPGFLSQSVTVGRRMILKLDRAYVGQAVKWANALKENKSVEEYSVGPATLEDVYVRRIGRSGALEMPTTEVDRVLRVQVAA
jgi:ABC-2 type transport system ATP-binding protein